MVSSDFVLIRSGCFVVFFCVFFWVFFCVCVFVCVCFFFCVCVCVCVFCKMVFVVGAAGRDQRAALGVENEMVGRNLGHERSGQPVRARDSSEMTGS